MLRFKNYISEEVLPTVNVQDGNIDVENDAVRGQINATLAAVTAQPAVTPYVLLRKVSKALSYFHIVLPKRTFLEGTKGIEVYEVMQFGDRMGMTDQGEFVRSVPAKFYLFFQYGVAHPFNVTYTKPNIDGMFRGMAKIVDKDELDRLLVAAEIMMAEACDDEATMSQRKAGREEIQTNGNHGSPSTDKAMDTSERNSDKKLASGKLDKDWPAVVKEEQKKVKIKLNPMKKVGYTVHSVGPGRKLTLTKSGTVNEELSHAARELTLHADNDAQLHRSSHEPIRKNLERKHAKGSYDHGRAEKLWGYHADRAAQSYHKQHGDKSQPWHKAFSKADRKAAAKHFADSARDEHGFGSVKEEQIDELSNSTLASYLYSAGDSMRGLDKPNKTVADYKKLDKRDHGMHTAANKIINRDKKLRKALGEEQIDELKKSTLASYIKKAHVSGLEAASKGEIAYANKDKAGLRAANKTGEKREQGIERAAGKLSMEEGRMPASVIAHKQKLANMTPEEKAKKFSGKSKEELESMARRHGYGPKSDEYSKHVYSKQEKEANKWQKHRLGEEQIDELKKSTLRSYRKHAQDELGDIKHFKKHPGQYPSATSNDARGADRREKTRTAGLRMVAKKLKEDEQIDEAKMTMTQKRNAIMRYFADRPDVGKSIMRTGERDRAEKKAFASGQADINRQKKKEGKVLTGEGLKFDPSTEIPRNS